VVRAANESGKTTILQGLRWALYGDADFRFVFVRSVVEIFVVRLGSDCRIES